VLISNGNCGIRLAGDTDTGGSLCQQRLPG
jgi:hypothetical protein